MDKKIQFRISPSRLFPSSEAAREFADSFALSFAQQMNGVEGLELLADEVGVVWPPSSTGNFLQVEIVFRFDNPAWVDNNLEKIFEVIFTVFKTAEVAPILKIKYEGEKGPRELAERTYNLLLPYNDESQGKPPPPKVDDLMPEDPKVIRLYPFDDAFDKEISAKEIKPEGGKILGPMHPTGGYDDDDY